MAPADSKPILLAFDGSEDSRRAIEVAGTLLDRAPAIVAHVWESLVKALAGGDLEIPKGMAEAVEESVAMDRDEAQETAEDGAALARESGFEASALPVEGGASAWPTLAELAERRDARVVVAGSRGLSGVRSALLGSVSNGLVHNSSRPVLVAPAAEDGPPATSGPILFGYDGSDDSGRAIEGAATILAGDRPGVVATVWTSVAAVLRRHPPSGSFAVATDVVEELDTGTEESARANAERGARLASGAGIEAEPRAVPARYGSGRTETAVWRELLRTADELEAAALVLGSRGRSATRSRLLGSVSYGVVHRARRPVLIVPPPRA